MTSIITPWLDHPELIPAYERAVTGAQVVIIDNGSAPEAESALREMVTRLRGTYIRNDTNVGYAKANNQGLQVADSEIVCFLNNDIEATGDWLGIADKVQRGALYGPSMGMRFVDGIGVPYLEGWCLLGYKADFDRIFGWNETDFPGLYWEDNELCWRAMRAGMSLRTLALPLRHLSNYTSSRTPGAYDNSEANRAVFEQIVRRDRANRNGV